MRKLTISKVLPVLAFVLCGLCPAAFALENTINLQSSNLPLLVIDTHGAQIRNSVRIRAHMGIIAHENGQRNFITDSFNHFDGAIAIEIRGSSGQWQKWPKQQYGFETQMENGDNLNVSLLGMPAENDWILYPPYSDKSLLRNVLAYRLSNDIGRYAPRTRFCELILNNDYRGIYVLIEKIKRDDHRIDIAKLRPEDNSGDELTGGYVIKVDRDAGEENEGWESRYALSPTGQKVPWLYHDPGADELTARQKEYIRQYILDWEETMRRADWADPLEQSFDISAFVDYYLINELAKNIDTYTFSTFFYKDRDSRGGKLVIGPVWDINLGFGNADYFVGMETEGWLLRKKIEVKDRIPFWLAHLDSSTEIQQKISERWQVLRRSQLSLDRLSALVDAWADTLNEAQQRNFERWPILGEYVWPNYFVGHTFAEEIAYLKDWLSRRWNWMDRELYKPASVLKTTDTGQAALLKGFPNPFNSETRFQITLTKASFVKIMITNELGMRIRSLAETELPAGVHTFHWDGLDDRRMPAASGVYYYLFFHDQDVERQTVTLIR